MPDIQFYNTLTRKEDVFSPQDAKDIRMYVCGPTVYDRPHIGNARSVVVYDVLFRLLRQVYGETHVTYVRNITDVDDKINAAAKANGEPISALTERVTGWFHRDMEALNCLPPSREPRATQHIGDMITMIEQLIANGHAYVAEGHVLFDVVSYKDYGQLSGRAVEEQQAGARIAVESYKRHPGDFVLWKPAEAGDDPSSVFDSPWGAGRPGWHIECSAMSNRYLGDTFDIHGGGADLMFPHHENERAQSCCSNHGAFARYWVHNGFLTVNGEKMSKSLGNFITVHDLLEQQKKMDRDIEETGQIIRFALLSTHYRKPLNWSEELFNDSRIVLRAIVNDIYDHNENHSPKQRAAYLDSLLLSPSNIGYINTFIQALCDDLNFSKAEAIIHEVREPIRRSDISKEERDERKAVLRKMCYLVGIDDLVLKIKIEESEKIFAEKLNIDLKIETFRNEREVAKTTKDFSKADTIRKELEAQGIILEIRKDGTTGWRRA